ncbi:VanZ family protein [Agrococcus sp. SL85]|uniref:VanZ family protein n=1 Tax=Agrococcus sp. SL85 TaxID=2995141 RepID=UPI00226D3352|nr:VanZ family protein [Agrococcus sp. SL85]WAC66510.1 VanZ family protein [Agrococcus sp. SL85]
MASLDSRDPAPRRQRGAVGAPLRRPALAALAILVPVALLVTLWPTHALLRLKPVTVRGLTWLHDRGVVEWLTWVRLEVLANVAMLVPVAAALALALGARRWPWVLGACVAASVGVELVQLQMPGRVASPLDVVANAAGAALGCALGVALERVAVAARRSRMRRAVAEHEPAAGGAPLSGPGRGGSGR